MEQGVQGLTKKVYFCRLGNTFSTVVVGRRVAKKTMGNGCLNDAQSLHLFDTTLNCLLNLPNELRGSNARRLQDICSFR